MRLPIHPEDIEAARSGIRRSTGWPRVERIHRALQPRCVCCTRNQWPTAAVQVHHIFPFHYCIALGRPDLELDQRNLLTLCEDQAGRPSEDHHLLVGHLDSFASANLEAAAAARVLFHGMTAKELRESLLWKQAVTRRLKPLHEMTEPERRDFARLIEVKLPRLR